MLATANHGRTNLFVRLGPPVVERGLSKHALANSAVNVKREGQ